MNWKKILKNIFPEEGESMEEFMDRTGTDKKIISPEQVRGFKNKPIKPTELQERDARFLKNTNDFGALIESEYCHYVLDYNLEPKSLILVGEFNKPLDELVYKRHSKTTAYNLIHTIYFNKIYNTVRKNGGNLILNDELHNTEIFNMETLNKISPKAEPDNNYDVIDIDMREVNNSLALACKFLSSMFSVFLLSDPIKTFKHSSSNLLGAITPDCEKLLQSLPSPNPEGTEVNEWIPMSLINILYDAANELVEQNDSYIVHGVCKFYIPSHRRSRLGKVYTVFFSTEQEMYALIKNYRNLLKSSLGEKLRADGNSNLRVTRFRPQRNRLGEREILDNLYVGMGNFPKVIPKSSKLFKEEFSRMFDIVFSNEITDREEERIRGGYQTRSNMPVPKWFEDVGKILLDDEVDAFFTELVDIIEEGTKNGLSKSDYTEVFMRNMYYALENIDELNISNEDYKEYLWLNMEAVINITADEMVYTNVYNEEEEEDALVIKHKALSHVDEFFTEFSHELLDDADIESIIDYMNTGPSGVERARMEGDMGFGQQDYGGRGKETERINPEGVENMPDKDREEQELEERLRRPRRG